MARIQPIEAKKLLGTTEDGLMYLSKHAWACEWYWSFGYIGNARCHHHIESMIGGETDVNKIFTKTDISQEKWWLIRDLFIQAYALQRAAQVYRLGGHQSTKTDVTDVIRNLDMAKTINADLEKVLDTVWELI